ARAAFDQGPWPRLAAAERADVLARLSEAIDGRSEGFAHTISTEIGSPIALEYYAGLTRDTAWEEVRAGLMGPALVRRAPVGVVAAIVPWNVPLYVSVLKLAPALAAGCTVVLKPAPAPPL